MPKCQAEIQIRKRIGEEKNHHKIKKLCLDEISIFSFSTTISQLLQACVGLKYLTLNNCKLDSLDGFPHLPVLVSLELADNRLNGTLNKLQSSRHIQCLDLSGNRLEKEIEFIPLADLAELQILVVYGNPFTDLTNYRQRLFDKLPSVENIDRFDRDDNYLSSEGEDSYITEKFLSRSSMDDIIFDKTENKDQQENKNSSQITKRFEYEQREASKLKRRRREGSSSDEEEPNTMMKEFQRKILKKE